MTYPTSSSASDVWSLRDVYKAEAGGDWPLLFAPATNPDFANVELLINADGLADGSTSFVDESNNNFSITAFGDAQVDTTVFKYGTGSIQFDGSGDYLRTSSAISLSGDFTVEAFVFCNPQSPRKNQMFGSDLSLEGNYQVYIEESTNKLAVYDGSSAYVSTNAVPQDQWSHVAVVRSGTTLTFYIDGVSSGTATTSATFLFRVIGALVTDGFTNNAFEGYIDEVRMTDGVAIYTSNFIPPTEAFPTS